MTAPTVEATAGRWNTLMTLASISAERKAITFSPRRAVKMLWTVCCGTPVAHARDAWLAELLTRLWTSLRLAGDLHARGARDAGPSQNA